MQFPVAAVAKFVFSAVVLGSILYLMDANDVVAVMAGTDMLHLWIAVGFALAAQFFGALRLSRLIQLQEIALPVGRVFLVGLTAVFYGLLVPGGSLAAFAVRFAQLSSGARVEAVAAALIVDRAIATLFLIGIGAITITIDRAELLPAVIISVGILVSFGIFVTGRDLFSPLTGGFDRWAGTLKANSERIRAAFLNYANVDRRQKWAVLTVSLLAHLFGCLMYHTISHAAGLEVSFLSICWIRSGMILWTMIPLGVGGLGLREIAAIGLLAPLGVLEAQAVGFSLMIFLATPLIVGLVGGAGELLRTIIHR